MHETSSGKRPHRAHGFSRAVIEVAFIIFLFYANLLMGEFTRSSNAHHKTLALAFRDIVTPINFAIALVSALIGYTVFEFMRRRF